ncbi:MAG TPA: DUF2715 domain-containing protein [Polyangia bacterium]
MTRTRLSLISTTAVASILGAALPAFAQAPAPAPMYAPAPAPAPMMAAAPEPMPVMPVAPVMAPRASDDMTGSVGFGVGVVSGSSVVKTNDTVAMKYWMSDAMAIVPRLALGIGKTKNVDTTWLFAPSVLADFTLLKGASTRLSAGIGLGLAFGKDPTRPAIVTGGDTSKTAIDIYVPCQIGVEHFFTRWFAMGVAAEFSFIDFAKQGTPWTMNVEISNTRYMGSLFFYTD